MQCGGEVAVRRAPSLLRVNRPGNRGLPRSCKPARQLRGAKADTWLLRQVLARQGTPPLRALTLAQPAKPTASSGAVRRWVCGAPGQRLRKKTQIVQFRKIAFLSYFPWSPVGTELIFFILTYGAAISKSKVSISLITIESFQTIVSGWCIVRVDCEEEVSFSR